MALDDRFERVLRGTQQGKGKIPLRPGGLASDLVVDRAKHLPQPRDEAVVGIRVEPSTKLAEPLVLLCF